MLPDDDVLRTVGGRRFFDYWDSLPKVDFLPDRKDFNPAAIHLLMPSVTMLEIVSDDFVLARLIGTSIALTLGQDMTGHNYLEYMSSAERKKYIALIETQFSYPCARRSVMRARDLNGALGRVEVLVLPMFYAHTGHRILLSYFEAMDVVGFEAGKQEMKGIDDIRWIDIGAGVPG